MVATVFDLELAREWRRIRQDFATVKAGREARCRVGRLDGIDVAVFGFEEGGSFRPVVLAVDSELEARLKGFSTVRKEFGALCGARSGPTVVPWDPCSRAGGMRKRRAAARGGRRPPSAGAPVAVRRARTGTRRPMTYPEWVRAQFDRVVDSLNGLDYGWAHACRYAQLGENEVMVIGFWVPEPVRLREGTRLRFEPALVRVDGMVERRLTDLRAVTLQEEGGGPVPGHGG